MSVIVLITRCVWLLAAPWAVAHQAPVSMGFSRQEYWSGLPFPSLGDLPDPETESGLMHCRQILYHLSPQGSPIHTLWVLTRSQQHAREKPGPSTCIAHWAKNMSQTQVRKNHITRMCSDLEMQGRHLKDIDLMGRLAHGEQCEGESSSGAASPRGIM